MDKHRRRLRNNPDSSRTGRLWIVSLLLVCLVAVSGSAAVVSDTLHGRQSLLREALFLSDKEGTKKWREILAIPDSSFMPVPSSGLHFQYDTSVNWVKIPLITNRPGPLVLEVPRSNLHKVNMYVYDTEQKQLLASKANGYASQIFLVNTLDRTFTLTFEVEKGKEYIVLIEAQSLLSSYTLPVALWEISDFRYARARDYLFWCVFAGCFLFMACFGVFLYISHTESIYLFYSAYVLSFLLWQLNFLGFLPLRWTFLPGFAGLDSGILYGYLLFLAFVFFSSRYLERGIRDSEKKFIRVYAAFLFISFFLSLFYRTDQSTVRTLLIVIYNITFLTGFVYILFLLVRTIRRGSGAALYYLIAISPLVLLFILHRLSKIFPDIPLAHTDYLYAVVTLFEMMVMMFGLTLRFKEYRDRHEVLLLENARKKEEVIRISHDLHDTVGAQFTILKALAEQAMQPLPVSEKEQKLASLRAFAEKSIRELRNSIWALNQGSIPLEKIRFRLLDYMAVVREAYPAVKLRLYCNEGLEREADILFVMHLLSVVQEATHNALKYAECSVMEIRFSFEGAVLLVTIADDGKGFECREESEEQYGLISMKKRMQDSGARLCIESGPSGTTITIKKQLI